MALRDRQRSATRSRIQQHALRLFTDRGYDATTVNEVADAAGVSAMTVYRHFPTKEDLVLYDEFDQLAATAGPDTGPLTDQIAHTILETLTLAVEQDRDRLLARLQLMITTPALQARHLDSQYRLQQALVSGIAERFEAEAAASACLGIAHTALLRWAADNGRSDLPSLFRQAFRATFGREL
ncbi:helix-turn-helix domain-containing protein [Kribbella sp. NPDC026611]|uniref:TetR/AcrR family transcriptional regulator n=1 Tax=Kribbella sp. NPDC026611 TaxID=3154911 RepID=UPI0033EA94C8